MNNLFNKIKEKNSELETDFLKKRTLSSIENKALIKKINAILDDIQQCSAIVETFEEYDELGSLAVRWQGILSTFFGEPLRFISLSAPIVKEWKNSAPKFLSEEEIKRRINNQAALIAYARELEKPNDRADENWHIAEINIASEILEGNINFANRIASESYERLENIWLKDVKLLQAYYRWINRGRPNVSHHIEDYLEVCKHIREALLVEPNMKALSSEFDEAKNYLLTHYVEKINNEYHLKSITRTPSNKLNNLIKNKACRISKVDNTEDRNRDKDWYNAETYVRVFYENIIPAVLDKDEEKTLRVLKTFQYSKLNRFSMVNCFEIALAIYFLDADVIENLWNRAEKTEKIWKNNKNDILSQLENDNLEFEDIEIEGVKLEDVELELIPVGGAKIIVEVEAMSWPDVFEIKNCEQCRKRFWVTHDRTKIGYNGVMLNVERKALLKTVDNLKNESKALEEKYKQAINELYVQSRIIHKATTL